MVDRYFGKFNLLKTVSTEAALGLVELLFSVFTVTLLFAHEDLPSWMIFPYLVAF